MTKNKSASGAEKGKTDASSQGVEAGKKRGWDEIEDLFDSKKKNNQEQAKIAAQCDKDEKERRLVRRKMIARERNQSPEKFAGQKNDKSGDNRPWIDDGLGGKFNAEGFTGRVEDGVKIFKAHVLSKPNAGQTPQCPFDCDCCYI